MPCSRRTWRCWRSSTWPTASTKGLWLDESLQIASLLESDGQLDALELTGGSSLLNGMYFFRGDVPLAEFCAAQPRFVGWALRLYGPKLFPKYPFEEGFFLPFARQFRAELKMPLVLLGGINELATIEGALAEGFDFVAMARALLREPDLVEKMADPGFGPRAVRALQQVPPHHLLRDALRARLRVRRWSASRRPVIAGHYFSGYFSRMPSRRPLLRTLRSILLAGVVISSGTVGCSSSKTSGASTASTAPAVTTSASFTAFGGVNQASVLDAPKKADLVLADRSDHVVASGTADQYGSLVFYDVTPGGGYTVRHVDGARVEGTKGFSVLDANETPKPELYTSQKLEQGLNYVKMRDGVELAMTVRLPPNKKLSDGPFPTVIEYSGYPIAPPHDFLTDIEARLANPKLPDDPLVPSSATVVGAVLAPLLGYATVSVQMRGSGCSGGAFDLFDLPTIYDGYDAVETVAAQSWVHAHKVGMVGISFSGISQLFTGGTRPPHLAALAPLSVTDDLYDGVGYPGGIFNTGFAQGWVTERQHDAEPAPAGGQEWAKVLVEQGDKHCAANQKLHDQARDALALIQSEPYRNPKLYTERTPATWAAKIDVPTFLVGGLEDEQLSSHWADMLPDLKDNKNLWVTIYNGNHNDALQPAILSRWVEFLDIFVAGEVPKIPSDVLTLSDLLFQQMADAPAPHLQQTRFSKAPDVATAKAEFVKDPRVRMLVDVGGGSLGPGALQPVTELAFDTWPPATVTPTSMYLGGDGTLVSAKPTGDSAPDSYQSDPYARPQFSLDHEAKGGVNDAKPPYDWAPVAADKGLGYQSEPMQSDEMLAGPSSLDVYISADGVDADLQATISEVRPDGQELYLGTGWLRASHRKVDEARSTALLPLMTHLRSDAKPLEPNTATLVRIPIFPTFAQIRKGSRIRLTITAPGGDRPDWKFARATNSARHISVEHSAVSPSALVLPVIAAPSVTKAAPCGALRGQPCRTFVAASNGG